MQLVNLLTELSWVNAGNSLGADGGACLMVSRPCCFSWLQWSVGSYLSGSQLMQIPCAGSVVVLMKMLSPERTAWLCVFYFRYLMVPTLRVFLLYQVFVVLFRRSTGRQRHLVPSPLLSPFLVCTAGVSVFRGPRKFDRSFRTDLSCSVGSRHR